jgi:hypothetical protein
VDTERLSSVQADPLLDGAHLNRQPGKLQTSVNADFQRSELTGSASIGVTGTAWERSNALADKLVADKWKLAAVQCETDGTIQFLALKEFKGFTAAMVGYTEESDWNWRVFIPFHAEADNPWNPSQTVDGGTCLDAEDPAAVTDSKLPTNNYGNFGTCDPAGC